MQVNVPVNEHTTKLLESHRAPNHAYILLEKRGLNLKPPGVLEPSFGLATLNVEHRPEQATKLDYYVMQKGFKVIGYGNFPKLNDKNPRRAQLAKWHSGVDGTNPWDELERRCLFYMNQGKDKNELQKALEEKSSLEAKLAEMQSRLEKQEDKDDKAKRNN